MGFLDLPAELRNVIYELLLRQNGTIEITHVVDTDHAYCRAITQVSRQIREECLSIYYPSNAFLLLSIDDCIAWLKVVGDECRLIKHIRLADGALDRAGWTIPSNAQHHRVEVSCRLTTLPGLDPRLSALVAEDVVRDNMKLIAENSMKAIEDATKCRGPIDIEISSAVYHCTHCAYGFCMWCRYGRCCYKKIRTTKTKVECAGGGTAFTQEGAVDAVTN